MPSSHPDVVRGAPSRPVQAEAGHAEAADSDPAGCEPAHADAPPIVPEPGGEVIEYVVRPDNDCWRIEHAGGRYGPYKSCREAMLFAIDAATKLAATGKNTRIKAIDQAGHLLNTWQPRDRGR